MAQANLAYTAANNSANVGGGLRHNWSSTVTDADPGAGNIRYNNATM
jgi:hypothetical protein